MTLPRRAEILSRCVAAILGGYALAATLAAACAAFLPLPRAEATLAGMLASFAVHAGAVIWVFAAASSWQGWAGLLGLTAPLLLLLLVLR
ncbi:DUF3649 domain-containing protein [Rhodovastum atsumiense]|uniref:DUF3649 domain-containing protein n=1 Tax=Rhodovastum atsumiense TaxID=504468 RepID=A0A5M6ILE1_9PROT|nr:DUF3649 domain-containing protein [Rhodovastum atsumiense]KAA5609091.1 DUF3649 domain-containing protein [Rhodovastum atsumiense]